MYPNQLPQGHLQPLMAGEQMVYFSNGGSGPFVPCPPAPNPYGPPISYGVQYSGMPQPGPQVMNCPIPFGAPSPPHWQHMGPVMPMFEMPPPRQPVPCQSAYTAPNGPAPPLMYVNGAPLPPQPYGQPFRPSQFPPRPAPYVMTSYPGEDVFIVHQDVVPVRGYGYSTAPVRGPMQPQCFPPQQYNQGGVSFISQHPPNMHSVQQQPLIQCSGMHPSGLQQTQNGTFHQQPFIAERVQSKKTEWEAEAVPSHVSQSYKAQSRMNPASSQKAQVTQPIEEEELENDPGTLPTASVGDDSVDKSIPSDVTPPSIPDTPPEEEERVSDEEIEEKQPGSDSLDSDEMLDNFGCSSSQTTLIVSPSSSDGSLTLCNSPVSLEMSDDDMSISVTDDNIPTKDDEYSLSTSYAECQNADNIAQRDLDEESKRCDRDVESKPTTAVSKKETQPASKASQQCSVLSGQFGPHIPSSSTANKERNHCSSPSSCIEDKSCCSHRKPERLDKGGKPKQTNTAFGHQKPCRIRSQIDRPVYQEKPSRILTAQAPRTNSPGKEQSSDNQDQCVRSYLTTHFRLLFEPIPQHPQKGE